ncbi:MAG TPA: hypothetical protein VJU86_01245 [Pyrinomonadaceae bacterium]|nr:hypothetical protein [Pyrinomonadaceae bacterium]
MKSKLARLLLIGCICLTAGISSLGQQSELPLTNSAIVKLVRAGFKEKTVIAIINSRPNRFNLEPEKLIELKRNGVNENIILAMLDNETVAFSEDNWSTDSMLGRRSGGSRDDDPGTSIFGGSQGSRSSSGSRGTNGGNETSSTTTGSATVKILRPPSEAGGAPLKLEKTPTLNNESVINLVEAGFSEGTIIKRIEDSPADFDLSAAKLLELRRRRVTDPIIAAMTAAMSDESGPGNASPARKGK